MNKLPKRKLGRTDLYVTPIGLGGAWLGRTEITASDMDMAVETILKALSLGINFIDTSPGYKVAKSEECVGIALKEWFDKGGRREELVLSTKTGTRGAAKDYSFRATMESVEKSLNLLQTDYLDIVLVHDPDDLEPVLAKGGALDALKELKEQKVIRAIGLGVRSHEFHRRCIDTGEFDVSLTYRDYNLLNQSVAKGIFPAASAFNVGVLNGTPVIKGLLGGKEPRKVAKELLNTRLYPTYVPDGDELERAQALWEFAGKHGTDLLSLNLQYCLRETMIASTLLGASSPEEIEADVKAVSTELPPEVWEALKDRFGI